MSSPKVSVYSVADLKNTTDDALPNYLTSLKFTQNHNATDIKLAVGYTAVTIAGVLFYTDWKLGWDVTKPYTLPAVVAYFLLNGIFTYFLWFVEGDMVFNGQKPGVKIMIETKSEKYKPIYNMVVRWTKAKDPYKAGAKWQEVKLSTPFSRWFTADGFFVAKPFQQWLASEVPVIGEADPNNVVEEIGRGNETSKSEGIAKSVDVNSLAGVLNSIQNQGQTPGAKQRRKG